MPFKLPILLSFQGSAHLFGVGSFSKEYKVFFFPPILIFENSPSILKSEQMSKKEYFIFFLKEYLKKENT